MANSHQTGKQSVNLAAAGTTRSRIRRDPPPVVKEIVIRDRDERDRRAVVIGVVTFALAILVVAIGFTSLIGWSPRQYSVHL